MGLLYMGMYICGVVGFVHHLPKGLYSMATNGIYMVDGNTTNGKTYSVWMTYDVADALSEEAGIQDTTKSKVFRMALMRYVDEMNAERAYNKAMDEARGRKYE